MGTEMKDEKKEPAFEDLPPMQPRIDGRHWPPEDDRRVLGTFSLDSGRCLEFGAKKYVSPSDGRTCDAFLTRSTSANRLHQSDETYSVAAAIELQNALHLFFDIRRREALAGRPPTGLRQPRDWVQVPRPVAPPAGPQPSRLQKRKAEAARRRGEPPSSFQTFMTAEEKE